MESLALAGIHISHGSDNALELGLDWPIGLALHLDVTEVGDDGGERLELDGLFEDVAHTVTINGEACYSGRTGQGYSPTPEGGKLRFVIPGGLPVGTHDVVVTWGESGESTYPDAVIVRRRHRRLATYEFARYFPARPYRLRGPVDPDSGGVLE